MIRGLFVGTGMGALAVVGAMLAIPAALPLLGMVRKVSSTALRAAGAAWDALAGVILEDRLAAFLDDLAAEVNAPITVTSGVRTAAAQAAARLAKLEAGETADDLFALYKRDDLIAELLEAEQTLEAWTAILEDQISRGDFLSSHLTGRALDLRSRDWTAAELAEVEAAVAALGGRSVHESTPEHLHIEVPS